MPSSSLTSKPDLYDPASDTPLISQQASTSICSSQLIMSAQSATKGAPRATLAGLQTQPTIFPSPHVSVVNPPTYPALTNVPPPSQLGVKTSHFSTEPAVPPQQLTINQSGPPSIKLDANQRVCISIRKLTNFDIHFTLQALIMQAVLLSQEAVNALPQPTRDATIYLVSCFNLPMFTDYNHTFYSSAIIF